MPKRARKPTDPARRFRARVGYRVIERNPLVQRAKRMLWEFMKLPVRELVKMSEETKRKEAELENIKMELRKERAETAEMLGVSVGEIMEAKKLRPTLIAALRSYVNPGTPLDVIAEKSGVTKRALLSARSKSGIGRAEKRNPPWLRRKRTLRTNEIEARILEQLKKTGKLPHGFQSRLAEELGTTRQYISLIARRVS